MRLLALTSLLSLFAVSPSEIVYRVAPSSDMKKIAIEMEFDASSPTVDLQLPSWAPGFYVKQDYWKTLKEITATNAAGAVLGVSHPSPDTWRVATAGQRHVKVRYERTLTGGMLESDGGGSGTVHYGGAPNYLYVVDRKQEPCRLEIVAPNEWKIAIGLNLVLHRDGVSTYQAKTYDVLADNPVTMGAYLEDKFMAHGKEYMIAYRGADREKLDRKKTVRICRFIEEAETDFFGGAPYDRYVWHFSVRQAPDGAGGLEHTSSTEMFFATGVGPQALRGTAHEFFHLWNVKRIRSKNLGPFDYTKLPRAGAMWWLEGVTDYYAMYLPYRYGAWGRREFFGDILEQVREVRRNQARFEVSPYDSGNRIPDAVNSFSSGYRVSYYPTGWTLGLMFDIELRARTNGKHSLDDVEHALWNLCKDDKPGFEDDEIRRQLIHFGGAAMGDLYDQWVMKPGELPVEDELAKVGLEIVESKGTVQERAGITTAERALLEGWLKTKHVPDPNPGVQDPLKG